MLRTNKLKQALTEKGDVPVLNYGVMASIPAAASIELIAEAGFDFVVIDTEHVLINPETIEHMIRTAESYDLTPLVRVADSDPKAILRLLDAGAQGIVLPNVEDAETLERAVAACRYAPQGNRSLNAGRPGCFGKYPLKDYVARANQQIMVVAMIESRAGVDNIEAIAAVPGLDLLLEGAADLSQSLGVSWQTQHPAVVESLQYVADCAQRHGVAYCAFLREPQAQSQTQSQTRSQAQSQSQSQSQADWRARGVHTFMLGDERGIAFRALSSTLASARTASGANGS